MNREKVEKSNEMRFDMNTYTCTCAVENTEPCKVHKKKNYRNMWKDEESTTLGDDETCE